MAEPHSNELVMESSPASTPPASNNPNKRKLPLQLGPDASDDGYEADTPPSKKPKTTSKKPRKVNKTPNKAQPLAATYDLCPAHDQLLIDMRDAGKSWEEIRKAWENLTGDKTAYSTLPNRYSRLKSNFLIIPEEDNAMLIEAKHEVDAEYEKEKWKRIAERMVVKGATARHSAGDVKRQYQKLMMLSEELRGMDACYKVPGGRVRKGKEREKVGEKDKGKEREKDAEKNAGKSTEVVVEGEGDDEE